MDSRRSNNGLWKRSSKNKVNSLTVIFSFRREGRFLSHRVNETSQSKGVVIKAGEYNFPFTFQIPQNVPPSCSYKNGKVIDALGRNSFCR